ncbi:MAG: FG-GAP repeat domain-containing protein [bacterium]
MAQAQFVKGEGEKSEIRAVPGPAKLTLVQKTPRGWRTSILEDVESNVFHKALWFAPPEGPPGILTIGGNAAALKLWRFSAGEWKASCWWKPVFGGTQNRLRDIETGDVTGDGINDLVIATHDQGVVAVAQWEEDRWRVTELDRSPDTFVHEIEIGDIDRDGRQEILATPSAPNRLDGTPQPGKIVLYRFHEGRIGREIVEEFPRRHVKEILAADLTGSGYPDLLAVIEGEMALAHGQTTLLDTVKIKHYQWKDGGLSGRIIADLPDMLCRYLTAGDVDGDGVTDIIASTMKSGIWVLRQGPSGHWEKALVEDESSGFEHATLIADLNLDGRQEIYVASDDQHLLRSYQWDGKTFQGKDVISLQRDDITFGLTCSRIGPSMFP